MRRESKGAIAVHHTATDKETAWDAGAALKNLGDSPTAEKLKELHAWYDSDKPDDQKSSYKFPHHDVSGTGRVGAANMKACASAIAALNGARGGGPDIPDKDRKGVYAHLAAHYKDAGMEAPDLKSATHNVKSHLRMEVKEISEAGIFEGILSPYNNVDAGGDVVEPGAYTKTLSDRGNKVPLLWQHKPDCPIGELTLEDRRDGLWCRGQLLMDLPEAKKAYLVIKAKIIKGLSIGFETVKDAIEGGVRHLKEIKLYEGSIVTFPMNEMAGIVAVKAEGDSPDDFNSELAEIQVMSGMYQIMSALDRAIYGLIWNAELTADEKASALDIIVEQFTETIAEFFPRYLAAMAEEYGEMWAKDGIETKEGRQFSASNMDKMTVACAKIKAGHDELLALLENGKAGSTTLSTKAAATKPEPLTHSAADHDAADMYQKLMEVLK